jgi:hypothetical protein
VSPARSVWDHANRAAGLADVSADQLAADLQLQYDAHGPRAAAAGRRLDAPHKVDSQSLLGHRAGVLGSRKGHRGPFHDVPSTDLGHIVVWTRMGRRM